MSVREVRDEFSHLALTMMFVVVWSYSGKSDKAFQEFKPHATFECTFTYGSSFGFTFQCSCIAAVGVKHLLHPAK